MAICQFRDRDTERFYAGKRVPRFQAIGDQAARRLTILNAAQTLADLAGLPSNRLEALRGDRKGLHSIRVNEQYRVCFRWVLRETGGEVLMAPGDAYDVEITDYH
jgi:toxin HigB-1